MTNPFKAFFKPKRPAKKMKAAKPKLEIRSMSRLLYQKELFELIRGIDGDIVECGVGEGDSLVDWAVLMNFEEAPPAERHLWGFDSFTGFPEPAAADRRGTGMKEVHRGDAAVPVDVVRGKLTGVGLGAWADRHVTLIPGYFEDTVAGYRGGPIALLHADADLYESYHTVLKALYDRVVPGGVIAFDEYRSASDLERWPGAARAIDEFLSAHPGLRMLHKARYDKYYLIKR